MENSYSNKHFVQDIFTPTSPAKINYIEREEINKRIVKALRTKGMQIVIYGHSGSGKTTLLKNKLEQTYERHVTTHCMEGMTYERILLDAFDRLSPFYTDEKITTEKTSTGATIRTKFASINAELSSTAENGAQKKSRRVLPLQLTGANLARMFGEANYCWVLEDFHKIDETDKKLISQLMKLFMDLSDEYGDLKIICVGAVNTARQVIEHDKEMKRRVAEIHIPLMLDKEIRKIVENGCEYLRVEIDDNAVSGICDESNGVASICHHLCSLMCDEQDIYETVDEDSDSLKFDYSNLASARGEYLHYASDTIKKALDNALKLRGSDNVIRALSEIGNDGAVESEIVSKLWEKQLSNDELSVAEILEKLLTTKYGELLKYEDESHKYSFSDPFYQAFSTQYFRQKDSHSPKKKQTKKELVDTFNLAMRALEMDLSVSQSVGDSRGSHIGDFE